MGAGKQWKRHEPLWYRSEVAEAPGHPFYKRLTEVLERDGFDQVREERCREFYYENLGRPSLAPTYATNTRALDLYRSLGYHFESEEGPQLVGHVELAGSYLAGASPR